MKKMCVLLYLVLILLPGCGKPIQDTVSTAPADPVPTETEIPTTMEMTESTAPIQSHSALFLPDYTTQQIQDYFREVVLDVEYSDGTGDSSLVQKWTAPISYRIDGSPTEEDRAVLNMLFSQLNEITGFPGIYPARDNGVEQIRISFLEPDIFRNSYSMVVNGEDAFGATQFWYDTDTNEIFSARIGHRTDLDQRTRNSILLEEIINTLGISDSLLRPDSIVYQYSNENLTLSEVDWVILKLLYHPDIRCGMDAEQCNALIEKLYY